MLKYLKNKNNKGFTLVEVIVVAVMVLILAAVAIPLYNGYMRDSRASVAASAAGSIAGGISAGLQARGVSATVANPDITWVTPAGSAAVGGTVRIAHHLKPAEDDEASYIRLPAKYSATYANGCVTVTYDNTNVTGQAAYTISAVGCDNTGTGT